MTYIRQGRRFYQPTAARGQFDCGSGEDHGPTRLIPRIMEWNLTLAHQFADNWVLQAGYVGTRAYHMWNTEATNLDQPGTPLDSNFTDPTGNMGRPTFNALPELNTRRGP